MKYNIDKNFTYHAPKNDEPKKYNELREKAKDFAILIKNHCPDSRERNFAFIMVENAVMWANASIARN